MVGRLYPVQALVGVQWRWIIVIYTVQEEGIYTHVGVQVELGTVLVV